MNLSAHAAALIESSKAWLRSAELDPEERKWHTASKLLAEDYMRLQARNAKLTAAATAALETLTANPAIDPGNVRAKLVEALETNP